MKRGTVRSELNDYWQYCGLGNPMHNDGQIDWQALNRLVEFHIKHGTDALVAVGTTGESATPKYQRAFGRYRASG